MDHLAERTASRNENCSVARTLDLIGSRVTLLLLREAFLGTRRFDDFAERVDVSEPTAARRLRELTGAGLLEQVPYREPGQRERHEYRLTDKGRDLMPVIAALREWGDAWAPGPGRAAVPHRAHRLWRPGARGAALRVRAPGRHQRAGAGGRARASWQRWLTSTAKMSLFWLPTVKPMASDQVSRALSALVQERDWSQFHSPENLAKSIVIEAAELPGVLPVERSTLTTEPWSRESWPTS